MRCPLRLSSIPKLSSGNASSRMRGTVMDLEVGQKRARRNAETFMNFHSAALFFNLGCHEDVSGPMLALRLGRLSLQLQCLLRKVP